MANKNKKYENVFVNDPFLNKEYICTDCGGDAYIGFTQWIDETGKKYYVEYIEPRNWRASWGDIDPASKTITGSYGDKHRGAIRSEESVITKENGFNEYCKIDDNYKQYALMYPIKQIFDQLDDPIYLSSSLDIGKTPYEVFNSTKHVV